MQTIIIKTNDNAFAKMFVRSIKEYKEIKSVTVAEEPAENYAAPGRPMNSSEFRKRIELSEMSSLITYQEAEQIINSWLKAKKK